MYKKQLKLQKILCFLAIVSSVLIFLYALGIMTDLYDTLYSTMKNPADLTETDVPGSIVYYNMQAYNSYFLRESIVLILFSCLLFLTNTHVRRKYYIGNYISVAIFAIANIYVAIEAHGYIEAFKERFLRIDFAALKEHGISSIEEANKICDSYGIDPYKACEETQPICFENAKWAYVVGRHERRENHPA